MTDDYCCDFKPCQSLPSGSTFKLFGAKKDEETPETRFNFQEIMALKTINGIVGYTFAGNLKMRNLMTGIGSHANTTRAQ